VANGKVCRTIAVFALFAIPSVVAAQRNALLISVDELASSMREGNVVMLQVGDSAQYEAEHIPGARFVQLRQITAPEAPDGLALELPEVETLRRTLEGLGITDDSRIVVYYGNDWVTPTTRVLLTLDWAGLGERTRLLDGGMPAWKAAGRPVTSDAPAMKAGRLSSLHPHNVTVTLSDVKSRMGKGGFAIVDARPAVYYLGTDTTTRGDPKMRGHIPGAKNLPFSSFVDESLHFRSTDEIRALFRDAGIAPTDTVLAYCFIGQYATTAVFGARLIGQPVRLYDGSFTEWVTHPDLPVEKGRPASGGDVDAALDAELDAPTSRAPARSAARPFVLQRWIAELESAAR
jgi:thiosulfate/3-mercaptopyruvate sulfurtransferase